MLSILFYRFGRNLLKSVWGLNLLFHLAAVPLTAVLVLSGVDWWWFGFHADRVWLQFVLIGAALLGLAVPVLVPVILVIVGRVRKNRSAATSGLLTVQAAIIALIISTIYKAFTGRVPPKPFTAPREVDFSLDFRFGLLNGGIVEGWPSGHTMMAFAMAVALRLFLPERKWIGLLCLVYAGYVGLGVSATIHWFSDAVAGGLIGVAIGLTVGKAFHARYEDCRSDSRQGFRSKPMDRSRPLR